MVWADFIKDRLIGKGAYGSVFEISFSLLEPTLLCASPSRFRSDLKLPEKLMAKSSHFQHFLLKHMCAFKHLYIL